MACTTKVNADKITSKQECIPVGCIPSAAVAARGVCIPACTGQGCIPACTGQGGVYLGGICPKGCLPHTSPVNRITDAYENITLPQLRCGW